MARPRFRAAASLRVLDDDQRRALDVSLHRLDPTCRSYSQQIILEIE